MSAVRRMRIYGVFLAAVLMLSACGGEVASDIHTDTDNSSGENTASGRAVSENMVGDRVVSEESVSGDPVIEAEHFGEIKVGANSYFPVLTDDEYSWEFSVDNWRGELRTTGGDVIQGEFDVVFSNQTEGDDGGVWYGQLQVDRPGLVEKGQMGEEDEFDVRDLCLGQFLVCEDKIVKTSNTYREMSEEEQDKLLRDFKPPAGARVVCREEESERITAGKYGVYSRIERNGDEIRCVSYDHAASDGRYEMYVWKKGDGLIAYRMGYGGEGDRVRLWREGLLQDESVMSETIHPDAGEKGGSFGGARIDNPFFPANVPEQADMGYKRESDIITGRVRLHMELLEHSRFGSLYQMYYNAVRDLDVETNEFVPDTEKGWREFRKTQGNGQDFGYFWVISEQIYYMDLLSSEQREKMLSQGEVPSGATLVCAENTIEDVGKGEGDHECLSAPQEDIRVYSSWYEDEYENGKNIRKFFWKRGMGLIGFYSATHAAGGGSLYLYRPDEEKNCRNTEGGE